MSKIIAVDFDGTLCENRWPEIGEAHWDILRALVSRQAAGDKLILWTCRTGERLEEAVLWCLNRGLRFDAVNENLPERIAQYGDESRKVSADEYWDDRAVSVCEGKALLRATADGYQLTTWEATTATLAGETETGCRTTAEEATTATDAERTAARRGCVWGRLWRRLFGSVGCVE